MSHTIKRNHQTELPQKIIFFDSESYVNLKIDEKDYTVDSEGLVKFAENKEQREHDCYLICACFTVPKNGNKETWKDYYKEDFKKEFWSDVDKFAFKKGKVWLFAHNAMYDVLITGAIPFLVELGYEVQSFSENNPFFIKLRNKETEKSIMILSSTNYYQTSLAKLGECFKIPKTEIDYAKSSIEDAIPYCRNDVLILKAAMEAFIKFIQVEDLGNFRMTIAGQAFGAYRHRFMKEDSIFIHREEVPLKAERRAYAGGRNECWKIGKLLEDIFYNDVNSMYPYVMKFRKYPVKLLSFRKSLKMEELRHFIEKQYLLICTVKVNTNIPVFFKKVGKLTFPVGEFITTISTPELIYGLKHNLIVEIYDTCIYDSGYIFSEYVDYFYNKRLEAKKNNDEVLSMLYKIFLNSLYGKFGQKNEIWEKLADTDPTTVKTDKVYNCTTEEKFIIKIFGGGIFKKNKVQGEVNESYNSFPAIAAHVTAYARMLLWHNIEIAGIENVYYMDTDSLFVNRIGYENLKKAGVIDENKLGKMKLEKTSNDVEIRGCKDYTFGGKEKIKGVSKNAIMINQNTFIITLWRGMSKAIKNSELNGYSNNLMVKSLKREYTKGIIKEDGNVLPHKYLNNERVEL